MIRYIVSVRPGSLHPITQGSNELTSHWIVLGGGVVGEMDGKVVGFGVKVGRKVVRSNTSQ